MAKRKKCVVTGDKRLVILAFAQFLLIQGFGIKLSFVDELKLILCFGSSADLHFAEEHMPTLASCFELNYKVTVLDLGTFHELHLYF